MNRYTRTGIEGLDAILNGGLPSSSTVLVNGAPGTGKTILGMQFLYDGAQNQNENGIYITFEQFPDQIYEDMRAFGWDIKALERENKLRVVCMSPETLLEQMKLPNGLFDQLVKEINCKRIVIDSLNLFYLGIDDIVKKRSTIYSIRNILRKHSLTSLLIHENSTVVSEEETFVNYVVDGVIKLTLQEQNSIYRKRTLEVLKLRGRKIKEGEHIYRINEQGIHLIPALTMIEDKVVVEERTNITTGIPVLDQYLSGGIPNGTSFIFDTNSKANYSYITASIVTSRILAGEKVLLLLSSLVTVLDIEHLFSLYGVSLKELVKDKKVYFIEHYDRPFPEFYKDTVIHVKDLSDDEFKHFIKDKLDPIFAKGTEDGDKWFVYYDLNTIVSARGKDFVKEYFTEEVAKISSYGMSMVALCNFTEIGAETASFLERTCNGVFQTWVDGNYQYFQLKKSPQGNMSPPLVVENIQSKPFIRLV
ncbi:ATPase domain-containing protein [Bacillus salitolerans]|uniref:ATPase domain-containing protein n=1 Tax=Bacillus salitolerans TaxID=1437434 RepID=A0ABW4LTT2_9BACI